VGPARLDRERGELTLTVKAANYLQVAATLRDHDQLRFEILVDLLFARSGWQRQSALGEGEDESMA